MSSYSDEQKAKLEKKRELINKVMFIPIAFLLGIIPLIVRLIYVKPKDERMHMLFSKIQMDEYYSQYKSTGIIILTVIMIILTYLFIEKSEIKKDLYSKIYIGSTAVLFLMTLVSTILSDYKEIAVWGVFDRAEGMVMWTCYLLMMLYTFYIVRDQKGYKWIVMPLIFLTAVTTLLGIFQYAGHDPLTTTKIGLNLVIPKELRDVAGGITAQYNSHVVLGTFYHYDYVGSFGAMMVPLFGVLTFMSKGVKKKAILGITLLAALFVLLGSTSRAGLVGVIMAAIVGVIIFGREIVLHWKKTLPAGIGLIIVLVGFNFATHGKIFSRIPTLVEDAASIFKSSDKSFNYKDHIPVREVINDKGEVTFVLQDNNTFNIEYVDNELEVKDTEGNQIQYTLTAAENQDQNGNAATGNSYMIEDPRYSNIQILRQQISVFTDQLPIDAILVTVLDKNDPSIVGHFAFKLDEIGITEIDSFSGLPLEEIDAKSIGFNGKEKLGSARGYIWSRIFPVILENNIIVGNGPDTFLAYFPQNDRLAKWWAYGITDVLVDKAHNVYLAIAMNQGCIALIAFLVLNVGYLIQSLRIYALKSSYDASDAMGIGIMLAVVGYLSAGFFNDSVVSVAPIYWILLGCGMAVNFMQQKAAAVSAKKVEYKVIKMKSK